MKGCSRKSSDCGLGATTVPRHLPSMKGCSRKSSDMLLIDERATKKTAPQ